MTEVNITSKKFLLPMRKILLACGIVLWVVLFGLGSRYLLYKKAESELLVQIEYLRENVHQAYKHNANFHGVDTISAIQKGIIPFSMVADKVANRAEHALGGDVEVVGSHELFVISLTNVPRSACEQIFAAPKHRKFKSIATDADDEKCACAPQGCIMRIIYRR